MDVNRGADDRYGMSVDANQAAYAGVARMDFVNGRQLSLGGGRRSDLGNVEGVVPSSAAEQTLFSADQVRRCFVILPGFVTCLGQGRSHVSDFRGSFLQRRPAQRRAGSGGHAYIQKATPNG